MADNKTVSEKISEKLEEFNRNEKRRELECALDTIREFILDLFDYLNRD